MSGFNSLQTGNSIQTGPDGLRELGLELKVSIPFKRETPSKLQKRSTIWSTLEISFNSLQTGNSIQTEGLGEGFDNTIAMFQFPSNGKLHPNYRKGVPYGVHWKSVSIPFKRETPSKQT